MTNCAEMPGAGVPRTTVARALEGNPVDGSIGPVIRGLRPGRRMWRCTTLAVVLAIAVSGGLRGQTERPSAPGSKPIAEERRADELADLVAADLAVSQPFPLPGETVTITARVDNRAGEPARGVLLRVLADGRAVAEKRVDVAAVPLTSCALRGRRRAWPGWSPWRWWWTPSAR